MDYKAFVSSTFVDLKGHRAKAIEALRGGGFHVDPMEDWTADNAEPQQFSQDRLNGCDVCVLLVALRRGFIPEGSDLSITQLEYQEAIRLGIDVLVFLLEEQAPWPNQFDELASDPGIGEWRRQLGLDHGVGWFDHDPESLPIEPALTRWVARQARQEAQTSPAASSDDQEPNEGEPPASPTDIGDQDRLGSSNEDGDEVGTEPALDDRAITLRFEPPAGKEDNAPLSVEATANREVLGRGQLVLELDALQSALAREAPVTHHEVLRLVDDRTRPRRAASPLDRILPWRPRVHHHGSLPSMEAATEIGTALHQALDRLPFWDRSTEVDRDGGADPGRVGTSPLVINATTTPSVAQLPWEFLHDPDRNDFLALNPLTPIIRTLDIDVTTPLAALDVPLRMLVAPAQVSGQAELAIDRELDQLEEALVGLTSSGRLRLDRLDRTDVDDLNDALYRLKPHILHFTGHGGLRDNDGFILISGAGGRGTQELSGSQLGTLLRSHGTTQPRLVFLNSCLGAAQSSESSFAGMAQTLIQRGVPAVVAMQFPIPDASAVGLAKTFYQSLADLEPVESALSAGRSFLFARDDTVVDWAAPALYKGRPEASLFHLADTSAAPAAPTSQGPSDRAARPIELQPRPATATAPTASRQPRPPRWLVAAACVAILVGLSAALPSLRNLGGPENAAGGGVTVAPPPSDPAGPTSTGPDSAPTTEPVTATTTGDGSTDGGSTGETSTPTTTATTGITPTPTTTTTSPEGSPSAVEFPSDSDSLPPQAEETLDDIAAGLDGDPGPRVVVAGPPAAADADPNQQALGLGRARAIVDALIERGIDPNWIDVVVGAEPFVDPGADGSTDPERTIRIIDDAVAVERGDSLWAIATEIYGDGNLWPRIHEANRAVIDDPDLIFPGQILTLPEAG